MATTRRGFLALTTRALGLVLGLPGVAWAQEHVRAIHEATGSSFVRSLGVKLRGLKGRPRRFKPYRGRERVPLPPATRRPALPLARALERYAQAQGFASSPLALETVARMLYFTNGVTGENPPGFRLRAAPSAGALYAGEVYLVAERVSGLAPGVYSYAPLEGALVLLHSGSSWGDLTGALESPDRARGAAAAVLLTNVFGRYRWRYAERGYRYALIDTGHLGENLRLAATSAGVAEWSPLRFQDGRLSRLLGIDGHEESTCAVHLVGHLGPARAGSGRALVEQHRTGLPLPAPIPEAEGDVPLRYHALTKLVPAELALGSKAASRPDATRRPAAGAQPSGPPIRLPDPVRPVATVEQAIVQRRSASRFLPSPIAAADLAFALEATVGHAALERAAEVEIRLFVHRVNGLAPGLYAVRASGRELSVLREETLTDALVDACLGQEMAGSAAVGFAMVADLARATRSGSERAYRDLLIEAGALGQRVYLAAEVLGLAARNLAAFLDDELNSLLGVDGRDQAVVHLTMLGPGG